MNIYKTYTFFYKMSHPFSNWYKCTFIDQDGIEYSCSEQYMMAEKAKLFGDDAVWEKIMACNNPRDHKNLGRKVKNFDKEKWEKYAREIVYQGLYYKFSQNLKLLEKLMETKGTLIVEASPYDNIWGIGLGENDPRIHDPRNWKGMNWLGEVLTKLRDDLQKSESRTIE